MTFDQYETSEESSEPIDLYMFAVGSFVRYYTSSEDQIITGGHTYEPIPISRTSVELNSEDLLAPVEITVPAGNEFVQKYIGVPPGQEARVTIDRLQRGDLGENLQREFTGAVHSVKFRDDFSAATIGAFWTTAKNNRQLLRFTFGTQCSYICGDPDTCKVNLELPAFKHSGQATTEVGAVLTVSGISGNFADGFFTGGVVRSVIYDDRRPVLDHVGNDLTLLLPFHDDILGTIVDVRAGCDHLVEGDCALKYDNVIEFGGWPFSPKKNPFKSGID